MIYSIILLIIYKYMFTYIIITAFILLLTILISWFISPYLIWKKAYFSRQRENIKIIDKQRNTYNLQQYRQLNKSKKIYLSIVVPSYNEQKRLAVMLKQTVDYLSKQKYQYQIIIVNDGSRDKTSEVALDFAKKNNIPLVVIEYPINRGKGGAVRSVYHYHRKGMQLAVGEYHLMVDADGATQFSDFSKLEEKMKTAKKLKQLVHIAGSRAHLKKNEDVKRIWYRKIFSYVLHIILTYFCGVKIQDTQCGFKLFTKETSKIFFEVMHVQRWSFDVELFIIGNYYKVDSYQIPVKWQDVQGSKLNVFEASFSIFRDILLIRLFYLLGLWKYNDKSLVV